MKKNNNIIYIVLLSIGFLFFMIGAMSLIAIVIIDNISFFIIAFISHAIGLTMYVICIIIYLVRRRKK